MEGSGSVVEAGFVQIVTDPDPGGPKSHGSYGSGSGALKFVDPFYWIHSPFMNFCVYGVLSRRETKCLMM